MTTRLGFIGFGIMGQRLLRAALNHDKSTIVVSGIFDPDPQAAAVLAGIDSELSVFDSVDAVIAASDCLHIASPPASHLHYLASCADMGKAALCEKPLSTDVVEATETVASLTARHARAAVNFPFASSFAVDHLRRWIDEGVVGDPERIDIELGFARWPRGWQMDAVKWLDRRAEGGFVREVGSHFLFLSQRLAGVVTLAQASCDYPDAVRTEHAVRAQLQAGELPVAFTGTVGDTDEDDTNRWTLTGSSGRIRLRNWSIAEREVDGRWLAADDAMVNEKARALVLARQLDKVAAMTAGREHSLATLDEALAVAAIVERILQAPSADDGVVA